MSINDRSASHDAESLIGRVANEFFERARRGEQPHIEEYVRHYPQIADLIRDVFPALGTIGEPTAENAHGTHRNASQPVPQSVGEFRIIREIGRGGMGIVFEAE